MQLWSMIEPSSTDACSTDTFFVAGAGNEDIDVEFAEFIPAELNPPTLLTVGATDDQDHIADFSSISGSTWICPTER
ncbi:MAG: hypothetical protein ACK57G_09850 [Planctomycetota bacterium]|jgi:hypothetical protein